MSMAYIKSLLKYYDSVRAFQREWTTKTFINYFFCHARRKNKRGTACPSHKHAKHPIKPAVQERIKSLKQFLQIKVKKIIMIIWTDFPHHKLFTLFSVSNPIISTWREVVCWGFLRRHSILTYRLHVMETKNYHIPW